MKLITPSSMTKYQLQLVNEETFQDYVVFFLNAASELQAIYKTKYDWGLSKIREYASKNRLVVCTLDGNPVGFMASQMFFSAFDQSTRILYQDLLYSHHPRATILLFKDFLTFGKAHADHVISAIGKKTNLKAKSLKALGFEELETVYRLEV